MARLVRHEATGPIKIEPPREKPIWVCACGLAQTFPICDGTHKGCVTAEQPGRLYVYSKDGKAVIEERDDVDSGVHPCAEPGS